MKWLNGWSAAATFEGKFSNVTPVRRQGRAAPSLVTALSVELRKKGIDVRKIDEARNVHGAPAVFLRYARSEYLVIAVEGAEREMTRTAWLNVPVWQFVVPPTSPNTKTSSGK